MTRALLWLLLLLRRWFLHDFDAFTSGAQVVVWRRHEGGLRAVEGLQGGSQMGRRLVILERVGAARRMRIRHRRVLRMRIRHRRVLRLRVRHRQLLLERLVCFGHGRVRAVVVGRRVVGEGVATAVLGGCRRLVGVLSLALEQHLGVVTGVVGPVLYSLHSAVRQLDEVAAPCAVTFACLRVPKVARLALLVVVSLAVALHAVHELVLGVLVVSALLSVALK
jgi:hypothetical protein